MRRRQIKIRRKRSRLAPVWGVLLAGVLVLLWFSWYVNTQVKPTLYELAEYEAHAITVGLINQAVAQALESEPTLCEGLYTTQGNAVLLDPAAANRARTVLVNAVQTALQTMPETERAIPFGSLTDNSLLSGIGPAWHLVLQPEGYVEGELEETATALAINTTRYSAELVLQVTINMVLDSRTATMTVENRVPLASVMLHGETPQIYAGA